MTHFHLMRTQKHKILSIIVLNMAKYTIILLILIDFVPIFFIFNLSQQSLFITTLLFLLNHLPRPHTCTVVHKIVWMIRSYEVVLFLCDHTHVRQSSFDFIFIGYLHYTHLSWSWDLAWQSFTRTLV